MKDRAERFCNNVDSKTVKSIEEMAAAAALIHNLLPNNQKQGGVIPVDSTRFTPIPIKLD